MSDSSQTHGLQPTRLLHPWDSPRKSTGVRCHCHLHLGSNIHSFQGDPSSQTLHPGSHIYRLKLKPLPKLHLWSQAYNVQGYPLPDYIHIVISPQSPGSASSPDTALWVTCPQSPNEPTSRTCTGGYVYSLQGDPTSEILHLGSHVQNLQGDPPPRSCTYSHVSTVSMVKLS